jgi:hypothetical protein
MNAWFRVFIVSLALLSVSLGEPVLIYSGTGKQVGDSVTVLAGPVKRFILIDPTTKQVASITYFQRQKQNKMALTDPLTFHRASVELPSGKTSVVYSRVTATENEPDFVDVLRALRGTQVGLKVESDSAVSFLHPRLFNGSEFSSVASGINVKAAELRYSVTYNQKRSIQANDADQTIDQAFSAIVAELVAKGFTLL